MKEKKHILESCCCWRDIDGEKRGQQRQVHSTGVVVVVVIGSEECVIVVLLLAGGARSPGVVINHVYTVLCVCVCVRRLTDHIERRDVLNGFVLYMREVPPLPPPPNRTLIDWKSVSAEKRLRARSVCVCVAFAGMISLHNRIALTKGDITHARYRHH